MCLDCQYEGVRRVQYKNGATFVPVCVKCHRFVKPDATVRVTFSGELCRLPNATCTGCGRTEMHFEGFI